MSDCSPFSSSWGKKQEEHFLWYLLSESSWAPGDKRHESMTGCPWSLKHSDFAAMSLQQLLSTVQTSLPQQWFLWQFLPLRLCYHKLLLPGFTWVPLKSCGPQCVLCPCFFTVSVSFFLLTFSFCLCMVFLVSFKYLYSLLIHYSPLKLLFELIVRYS